MPRPHYRNFAFMFLWSNIRLDYYATLNSHIESLFLVIELTQKCLELDLAQLHTPLTSLATHIIYTVEKSFPAHNYITKQLNYNVDPCILKSFSWVHSGNSKSPSFLTSLRVSEKETKRTFYWTPSPSRQPENCETCIAKRAKKREFTSK